MRSGADDALERGQRHKNFGSNRCVRIHDSLFGDSKGQG
jgi:hypothetical protein